MLVLGLLATIFGSLQVKQAIEDDAGKIFSFHCDQVTLKISERLGAYALILRSGAAFIAGSQTVKRLEWKDYVETLSAQDSIPGVQGLGFSKVIRPDQLDDHIASIRAEGFPEYTVWPIGKRALYTSIIYLEPFRDRNLRAFGFDMFSEPVRRTAMEQARDTGKVSISGKVELMQETGHETQSGTLMYVPVYRHNMPSDTLAQKRAALIGWVYSPYRMNDLMSGILRDWENHERKGVELNIYDGLQATPASLLFDSNTSHTPISDSRFYQTRTIEFNGKPWLLVFDSTLSTSGIAYASAWMTLIGGLAISFLLFGLMISVINTRTSAARIANKLTEEIKNRQALLQQSEAHFCLLSESAQAMIWMANVDKLCIWFNKVWLNFTGRTLDQEYGNGWVEGVHPDDLTRCWETFSSNFDIHQAFRMEYRLKHHDGKYRWILDIGNPYTDAKGQFAGYIGSCFDITEHKQAEMLLRESEARYCTLFSENIVPMLLIDTSDGRIVDANKQASIFYGWETDTLRTMNIRDINTLGSDQLLPELGRALHFNKRQLFFQHRRANGELRDVEFFSGPVVLNGKTLLLSSITDITERKKTELALHESESFNATVLNSLVEHIAVLDSQGIIVSVNSAWLQFARENNAPELAEQWIGVNYLNIYHASFDNFDNADGSMAQSGIRAVLSGEVTDFDMEYACHSPEEQRWFIMHVTPLRGTNLGVVVAHENITHRKLSEFEIQKSHTRLEYLALQLIDAQEQERKSIARELHDEMGQRLATLNLNLHHIRQYIESFEAVFSWERARADVATLISQMRNISSALRPPILDYLGLEASISQLLQQHFSNSTITYVLEYAGLPNKIAEQIEITVYRIIQESITNIVRHADASHVIVEVNGGGDANEIEIIIRDNGIGFDPAHVDLSQQRSFGLIGMGERVKLLNGELHVSSTIGSGTRITALLPLKND